MDEATFTQHAMQWRDTALRTCRAYCGDSEVADDVAQDVLMKLWMMRDELDRYQHVDRLVAVMARHLAVDNHRRQRQVTLTDAAERTMTAGTDSPIDRLESLENEAWLKRRLDRLPSLQQSVLHMRQVEHRTYAEIAALLGVEQSSARTLLSRARKTLLEEFKRKLSHE